MGRDDWFEHDELMSGIRGHRYGQRRRTGTVARERERTPRSSETGRREIRKEGARNEARMASIMRAGHPPDSEAAMDCAEAMRLYLSRRISPCSHEMHAELAEMYETDRRFSALCEEREVGLARFIARAIRANSRRARRRDRE